MKKYFQILKISSFLILLFGCQVGDEWLVYGSGDESGSDYFHSDSSVSFSGPAVLRTKAVDLTPGIQDPSDSATIKFAEMPEWATTLGLENPAGLSPDLLNSQQTSVSDQLEGFNSITLVYHGDYFHAKKEAVRIAKQANLSENTSFRGQNPDQSEHQKFPMRFMNYDLLSQPGNYYVSIELDITGTVTIMATDVKQLNERLAGQMPHNKRLFASGVQKN